MSILFIHLLLPLANFFSVLTYKTHSRNVQFTVAHNHMCLGMEVQACMCVKHPFYQYLALIKVAIP